MADRYTTKLSPDQQKAFDQWAADQSAKLGYNILSNDYDMQGWFKENGPQDLVGGAHFTDKYKKPNHPTFSTDSQYSGRDGNYGGTWIKAHGKWTFTAGPSNLLHFSAQQLREYFDRVEPNSVLNISQTAKRLFPNQN